MKDFFKKVFGASYRGATSSRGSTTPSRGLMRTLGVRGYEEIIPGLPDLEFMSELEPPDGLLKFRKMEKNDPIIGGLMLRLKGIFSQVQWKVSGESAPFIQEQLDNLPEGVSGLLEEMASALTYGFFLGEMIFKWESGVLALKDIEPRFQTSIYAMTEREATQQVGGAQFKIPMQKCLHYVFSRENRSPYGVSILRHIYKPYYYKVNCEAAEATAIDRDLSGLPTMTAPEGFDFTAADPSSPSYDANVEATLNWAVDLVGNVRRDNQQGVVIPSGWTFELVRGSGTPSIDTTKTIQRYNSEIAVGLLEGFALNGTSNNGVGATEVLIDDFLEACSGFVASAENIINSQVINKLLKLNNLPPGKLILVPPRNYDLSDLASFVARLVARDVITPTTELESTLLTIAGLPEGEHKKLIADEEKK